MYKTFVLINCKLGKESVVLEQLRWEPELNLLFPLTT